MSGPHVVIVGASVAGLGAAWQLTRRGYDVTVFEAEQRAGGRVETVRDDGFALDVGNPLLSTGDRRPHGHFHPLTVFHRRNYRIICWEYLDELRDSRSSNCHRALDQSSFGWS